MVSSHDDKHPESGQTIDLDSAIDELEDLLSSHDEDLHQAACPGDDEEDIPVLMDVVEPPEPEWRDFELAEAPPTLDTPESLPESPPEDPVMEREPMLPFEFMDEVTPMPEPGPGPEPEPSPATEPTDGIPEFELEPEPCPAFMPEAGMDEDTGNSTIIASEPEAQEALTPGKDEHSGRTYPGELTPQLLDELESIIDQELQRVTADAKQSILSTLRAHLNEAGRAELDSALDPGVTEHFPATAPDNEPQPGTEEDNPPLRPFDPFNDPD